jgi:hypothetical protein
MVPLPGLLNHVNKDPNGLILNFKDERPGSSLRNKSEIYRLLCEFPPLEFTPFEN